MNKIPESAPFFTGITSLTATVVRSNENAVLDAEGPARSNKNGASTPIHARRGAWWPGQKPGSHTSKLDIQVLHIQRVVFDKLPPRFHVFTHEGGENGLGFRDVFELY
jgi:hypothetical protein